tara:strand:- start:16765 stop:17421 length:657 start_codon:yes stop_codon:yes gene_type:complete
MGKVAKVALPLAAVGLGAYAFGPSLLGGTAPVASATSATATIHPIHSLGPAASSSFSFGSLWSGAKSFGSSLFKSKGLGLAMGGLAALSSYRSGQMMKYGYEMDAQRFAEEQRLAGVQAQLDEANVLREAYIQKNARLARAAAMGKLTYASRSFMAALDREEASVQRELDAIRVNAASANRTTGLQIGSKKTMASQASITGGIDTGRNLFKAVKGYMD